MVIKMIDTIFADGDHYEEFGLDYPNVSDPIKDSKGGTLTLHGIYDVFSGTAASYTLVVDGQSWKVAANKVNNGDLSFTLPKMTSGDKYGIVYAQDSKGNNLESASVYFDVDDITAPVVGGKLAVTQHGNDFDLSWTAATDNSPYEWSLTVKDGKNNVWQNDYIPGDLTSLSVSLAEMAPITGKKLTFELYAHQEITEKGQPVTLNSKKLSATASISDAEAPVATTAKVFSDIEYAEVAGLSQADYWTVSDPIKNSKGGTLTLYGVQGAFEDNVGVTAYELVVEGNTYKCTKVNNQGGADFSLSKMTSGFKTGTVYALDAAGNRSEGVEVHFDVDDIVAPVVGGKLAVTQHGNDFDLSWTAATDESPYAWSLTVKDGKNIVWQHDYIPGDLTSLSINLAEMAPITGKKLTFELYAHQQITEKGQPVTLSSKKLSATASISDAEAPVATTAKVFSDIEYAEVAGLSQADYWTVSDPIKNSKGGKLTLYGVQNAFEDNVGVTAYELVVEGSTYKCTKVNNEGGADFTLPKMTSGFKTGTVYALDAAGNRSEGVEVHFDVDDIVAPVLNGKLIAMQNGGAMDLSWAGAVDESPFDYVLTAKSGNQIVFQDLISGMDNFTSIDLGYDCDYGTKLTFELYATQEIMEKGQPVTLNSKKLTATATYRDWVAPEILSDKIFSDSDHANFAGLEWDEYWLVGDPIHNGKGNLQLLNVDQAFADDLGIATYELVVDGKTFKTAASKMAPDGSVTFALSGISNGDKQGAVYAVDAAGNRSEGIDVFFDADSKKY